MQIFDFEAEGMRSAAQGRIDSVRWRASLAFVYAFGGAFALHSLWAPLLWGAVLAAAMALDVAAAKRYVTAETKASRAAWGRGFALSCLLANTVFTAFVIYVGVAGGAHGRVFSVFTSASSVISVFLFMQSAPLFMAVSVSAALGWLSVQAFVPIGGHDSGALWGGLAQVCGFAGFLAYVWRAAQQSAAGKKRLLEAMQIAQDRQAEAESKVAEAERANRVKNEFMTTMTHELRTPLNAVIGYSELIGEDMEAEGRSDLAGDARRINSAARHLLGLIDQILHMSTLDGDRASLQLGDVDVRALVEGAIANARPAAEANNNRLSMRVQADFGMAHTDAEKLGTCLAQLVSNAVKFTHGGLVAISVEREGTAKSPWMRIAVSDTGVGMSADDLEKAFKPFTQIDGSMMRTAGGMGLGLSITLANAKALGGEVIAVSEPGAGSTFTLRLPMRLNEGACATQSFPGAAAA